MGRAKATHYTPVVRRAALKLWRSEDLHILFSNSMDGSVFQEFLCNNRHLMTELTRGRLDGDCFVLFCFCKIHTTINCWLILKFLLFKCCFVKLCVAIVAENATRATSYASLIKLTLFTRHAKDFFLAK